MSTDKDVFTHAGFPFVLHIGLPRTGSTWLREQLFDKLKDTVYNPDHLMICLAWHQMIHYRGYESGMANHLGRQLFLSESLLADGNSKNLILSSEVLSADWFFRPEIHMAPIFKIIMPKAKVLVVLRDFDDWLYSMYSLSVQNYFKFRPYEEFINGTPWTAEEMRGHDMTMAQAWNWTGFKASKCKFEAKVQKYTALFDDVKIMHYEDLNKDCQAFADEVCDWMGVPKVTIDREPVNASIDIEEIMEVYNSFGKSEAVMRINKEKRKLRLALKNNEEKQT